MWPAVSLVKKWNAGQLDSPKREAAYWPSPKPTAGSFLPWTIASGTGPLRLAQGLVLVGTRLALEDHPARDGEGPRDQLRGVHQQAIGEEAALRMAADEVARDRIRLLQIVECLGDQCGALAVRAGVTLVGAPADVVDVAVVEPGLLADLRGRLAVDAQDHVLLGDLRPGHRQGIHVGFAVHVRAVEDDDGRPSLRITLLVALGGADAVGEQPLGGPVDDLARHERYVRPVLRGASALPLVPERHSSSTAAPSSVLPSLLRSNQPLPGRNHW